MQIGNQSFIKVDENSTQDKRDFKEVNLYEEVNFDLSKRMKEWLGDILNFEVYKYIERNQQMLTVDGRRTQIIQDNVH